MTPYDPQRHHRRSIRLPGYDYTQPGAYFITIVTHERACLFGEVMNGEMELNEMGQIARQCWLDIPKHFGNAAVDAFVVMPNHIHGIIVIHAGATHASPLPLPPRPRGPQRQSIASIVGSFKSATAKRINALRGTPAAPVWQRNYCEHIVRNDDALQRIRQYLADNPQRWALDRENPDRTGVDEFDTWLEHGRGDACVAPTTKPPG